MSNNNNTISLQDPSKETKPRVSMDKAVETIWRHYGLKVLETAELPSYDDQNYFFRAEEDYNNKHISNINTDGYVLKIINSLQSSDPTIIEAQLSFMSYIRERGVATQDVMPNKGGAAYSIETFKDKNNGKTGQYVVWVLTFIPGKTFNETPHVAGSVRNIGEFVGKFHNAVKGFHHPFYDTYTSSWNLQETPLIRNKLHIVNCKKDRAIVEEVVDAFENSVIPKLSNCQRGTFHGDLNDMNIVMKKVPIKEGERNDGVHDVAAMLDFMETSQTYKVMEVALVIAYLTIDCPTDTQLEVGGHFLAGYNRYNSLNGTEFKCLKKLVCARLCQSLVYGLHSYTQQPWNEYLMITNKRGWPLLYKIWNTDEGELYCRWNDIIKSYTN